MTEKIPKKMQEKFDVITQLTDDFCKEHLNDEYAQVCRKMTAKLARKRPSPLANGRVNTWAVGIVYAVGQVNFLFDKSQTPYMAASELAELFGVASSTAGNKAKTIRTALKISVMDADWTLPSRMDGNIMAWMIIDFSKYSGAGLLLWLGFLLYFFLPHHKPIIDFLFLLRFVLSDFERVLFVYLT